MTLIPILSHLKDPFALPRIDQVTDSTAGCVLLSFLDYYSGYHQIALKEEDHIKTTFITPFGAYAYTTTTFGLKNAGVSHLIYKDINRAIIYAPGSSHAYIQ
jgi:hypothetical protein